MSGPQEEGKGIIRSLGITEVGYGPGSGRDGETGYSPCPEAHSKETGPGNHITTLRVMGTVGGGHTMSLGPREAAVPGV